MTVAAPVIRARRTSRIRIVGAAVLIGLSVVLALDWGSHLRLQSAWFDAYQEWRPRQATVLPATIVEIDDNSIATLGRWPWPRTLLAQLVHEINRQQPAAIGIDILMPEVDPLSPERLLARLSAQSPALAQTLAELPTNDSELARELHSAPTVLAMAGTPQTSGQAIRVVPVTTHEDKPKPDVMAHPLTSVQQFAGALTSIAVLNNAASGWGLISTDEVRGSVRRIPLLANVGGTLVPALAMEMWRVAQRAPDLRVTTSGQDIVGIAAGELFVPTEPDGAVRINFSPRNLDRFVSAIDVLEGRIDPQRLKGQLVVIGITAVALGDYRYTPVGQRMPGSEIHAQLLENIYEHSLLSRPAWAPLVEAGQFVFLAALLVWFVPRRSVRVTSLLALGCVAVPMIVGYALYRIDHVLIDAATPAIGMLLLFAILLALTLADAHRHERSLQRALQLQREESARVAGELQAARRVQMESLPRPDEVDDGRVELAAAMEPAREVGGDLYDFYRLDEHRLFFMVGDVAGKGLSASIFMAVSKALCKSTMLRSRDADIGSMMSAANGEVGRDNAGSLFVTAFTGILDLESGALDYCNAGHENPFLIDSSARRVRRLVDGGGPPLCAVDDFTYRRARERMRPGDLLCIVSDGITEAQDRTGGFYGASRIEPVLAGAMSPDDAVTALLADVRQFVSGQEPADDVTVLVLRWRGPTNQPRRV